MAEPKARVVVLGASNVTRGAASLIETARLALGCPVEFLIAKGHGRSYGARSRVLWRGLPGIIECGLWEALQQRTLPTYALVTDVGNDLIYGASVDVIAGWVRTCLERLAACEARTVLSLPPLESLARLQPWRFAAVRSLLFPGRRMTLDEALDAARRLDAHLRRLSDGMVIGLVRPPGRWYGPDPIHPWRFRLGEAWQAMLRNWTGTSPLPRPGVRPGLWLRLHGLTPERWWLMGAPRGRIQPAARLSDGTTLSFY